MIDLTAAGLTSTEAKCYTALLEQKDWKPAELAKYVHETRTNCYKLLDKLVEYKLAERFDKAKKLHYRATNPARLLQLARQQQIARDKAQKELEANAQALMQTYFQSHEQAGIRYFQGEAEIGDIFTAISQSSEEVVFVHTTAGVDFYGFPSMHNLRMLAPLAGVTRRALTPDSPAATKDYATTDPQVLLKRTWLKKDDYTAPVEWGAFEDKVYVISYGKEALGLMIESPQIAESFKQLFSLLERGQKLLPRYQQLPRHAQAAGQTSARL
jgi:sugar-specific transcriptional regulator TrmB